MADSGGTNTTLSSIYTPVIFFFLSSKVPQIWWVIGSKRGKSISPCWSSIWYSKSAMSQNFCGFVSAPIKWFRHFTITACHSVDRTTWLLVVYTEPSPRTFLVYKCLNLVQMSFVLQHCVPPTFIFFLSLQKKKNLSMFKKQTKKQTLNRASYFPMRDTIQGFRYHWLW